MSSPSSHIPNQPWHTPMHRTVIQERMINNKSWRHIEQDTGIPFSTARNWVNEYIDDPDRNYRRSIHDPMKDTSNLGAPLLISDAQVREMELILEAQDDEHPVETKALTWEQLGFEAGLDIENISGRTIQRRMGVMDYHKCIACRKGWCNRRLAERRLEYARVMKERYPEPEDWFSVRFSDECHFGWGSQGKAWIIRKPGQRYCQSCIQQVEKSPEKDNEKFRHHTWAGVGYNFKSDLTFYQIPTNTNGKMTKQVYRDEILKPIVKPWVEQVRRGKIDPFVLEEDGDSGHGTDAESCIVRKFKAKEGINTYRNCASSPDLAPIENCWQPPKQILKKYPHWDDQSTKHYIVDGWEEHVPQKFINECICSMPKRLQAVIDGEGQMTGF